MHEAAIAKEVFDIAQQAMAENGLTRLTRVVMDIGEYSAVVPEQLQLVFRIAVHNTAMDGCALEIHDLPGELGMYVRTIEGEWTHTYKIKKQRGTPAGTQVPAGVVFVWRENGADLCRENGKFVRRAYPRANPPTITGKQIP